MAMTAPYSRSPGCAVSTYITMTDRKLAAREILSDFPCRPSPFIRPPVTCVSAITGKEIAALIEKESGIAVDKKKLVVDTIKNFGTYAVTVKLYTGIAAKINVSVEKE